MKKNVASQVIGAQMITASDGSAFTGTTTVYVTGDAGTQALGSVGSGVCTHEGNGYHTYVPAQAETNYDQIAFTFIGTGAIPATIQVYPAFPQTGDSYARIGAPAGASISADIATVDTVVDAVKVKTDYLPSATAGATGGVFIAGTNAATSITTALTANITGNLSGSVGSVTGAVGSVTGNVGGNVSGSVGSVTGAINTASGTITTLDALDTAQDSQHSTTQSAISGLNNPTVAAIADGVWDEAISGHLTGGTTGAALNAAGAAGDPWSTALPGAYSAGTAGYIVGTNVNAPISTVDTVVDAIKVVTDQFTFTDAGKVDATLQAAADLKAAVANRVADHVLRRSLATALASADGDTKTFRSLAGATAKLVNKVALSGSTLTIYETNDTTSLGTQTATTDAAAEPITTLDTV